ncbi:hypothetical protein KOAAANKH_00133 [Brevundimonas sp. NIBR10]|uniref:hypothetical protein n=1 Tax=Brevundimonas sp. NIBR10 TaxID=3015997 RepID=UPI0022F166A6|nr:hypothetical protein [Brevundimonas sp. NIBR10]WGM45272.1 hypothetical protein KOAAANKH_00133 [Brevundimonas sp. NIBR10]
MTDAANPFPVIPDRHPRLPAWARAFRRAGWPLRQISALFEIDRGALIEAGVEP